MERGGKKNELVISRVRVKTPRRMQQGNREWVALIECVSAVGIQLPAFYIYAGAAHYKGWHHSEAIDPETGGFFLRIQTTAGRRTMWG
jgi:hypothetical protein